MADAGVLDAVRNLQELIEADGEALSLSSMRTRCCAFRSYWTA
jgi:hypothetical protein